MQGNGSSQQNQQAMQNNDNSMSTASTGNNASQNGNREGSNIAVNRSAASQVTISVDEITDYNIVGQNGNVLGDIQNVVKVEHKLYAVIGSGGFLGLGEKEVAIPLSSLVLTNNGFVAPNISESQIGALQEFNEDQYPELDGDQTITIGQS